MPYAGFSALFASMNDQNPPKKPVPPPPRSAAPPPLNRPPVQPPRVNPSPAGSPAAGQQPPAGQPPISQPESGQSPAGGPAAAGQPPRLRLPARQKPTGGQPPPPPRAPTAQQTPPPPPHEYLYDAFISYRHVDPDRQWAKWLHSSLETYRVPQRLRQLRRLPARLKKVFRDEEELPASADLNGEIEKALQASRFLIVICSPRTPESLWVNKEVQRFREMRRHDKILALLIDGEPGQSFPQALREIRRTLVDARGNEQVAVEQVEPLAADVRPGRGDESPRHLKRMAKLRMLACILGVSFDDLRRRDRERFVRRAISVAASSGVLVLLLAVLGFLALRERDRAEQATLLAENRRQQVELEQARVKLEQQRVAEQTKLAEEQAAVAKEKAELAEKNEQLAKQKEEEATLHNLLKRREIYIGNVKAAWNAWQRNDLRQMAVELDKYDPRRAPEDATLRGFEWYFLKMLPRASCRIFDFGGLVRGVRFNPQADRVAAIGEENQHCVKVWTLPDGRLERTLNLANLTNLRGQDQPSALWRSDHALSGSQGVAYSPDGRFLAGTCLVQRKESREGIVKVWEADSGREVLSASDNGVCGHSVIFSPDSKYVVAGGYACGALVWSLDDGKLAWTLPSVDRPFASGKAIQGDGVLRPGKHPGTAPPVASLFFRAGGTVLTRGAPQTAAWPSGRREGSQVTAPWATDGGEPISSMKKTSRKARERGGNWLDRVIAFSPNGRWALAPDEKTDTVRLLALDDKERLRGISIKEGRPVPHEPFEPEPIAVKNGRLGSAAICDRYVAISDGEGVVDLGHLDLNSRTVNDRQPLRGHMGAVTSLAFSDDQKQLAAAGSSSVVIWSTQSAPEQMLFEERGGPPWANFNSSIITVFDPRTLGPIASFKTAVRLESALAASPDGKYCAIADHYYQNKNKGDIYLYEVRAAAEPRMLRGHTAEVTSLTFDAGGRRLLSASHDGTVRLWDISDGREIKVLRLQGGCRKAGFAGGDKWIVADSAKEIVFWPAEGNDVYRSIKHSGGTHWTCSPDGTLLAVPDGQPPDLKIKIWNIEKNEVAGTLPQSLHEMHLAFTTDGKRLLVGNTIWSVESFEDVFDLPGGTGKPEFAAKMTRLEGVWRSLLDPPAQ